METSSRHETKSINAEIKAQGQGPLDAGNRDLVWDIFIQTLRCPKLLRKCRLVCHSWNISACAVLRTISVISFTEPSSPSSHENEIPRPLEIFSQLVRQQGFPRPFKKISIAATLLQASDFWDLVKQLKLQRDIHVTELEVCRKVGPWNEDHCRCLENIFECHQDTLTSLKIYSDEDLPENVIQGLDKFPSINLKKLYFDFNEGHRQVSWGSNWTIFIKNILCHSKLMELTIGILFARNSQMLKEILAVNLLKNVASLRFGTIELATNNYAELMHHFYDHPLPNLKHVAVYLGGMYLDLGPFLSNFSNHLQVLVLMGRPVSLESFPVFPNLRELFLICRHKGQIAPEKFPSLKKLKCTMSPPSRTSAIIPHFGLDSLDTTIDYYGDDFGEWAAIHSISNSCDLCEKIKKLTAKSSDLLRSYFGISNKSCFTVASIREMQDCFPNLKTLILWGHTGLHIADGFENFTSSNASPRDLRLLEKIVREIFPLESFLSLEALSTNATITPAVIKYSLSRIPRLRTLRFEPAQIWWQPSAYRTEMLTSFRDYLGHLQEIQATGCKEYFKIDPRVSVMSQLDLIELLPLGLFRYICYCDACGLDQCDCVDCHKLDEFKNPLF